MREDTGGFALQTSGTIEATVDALQQEGEQLVPTLIRRLPVAGMALCAVFAVPSTALAAVPCDQNQPPQIGGFMNPSTVTQNNHKYVAVQAVAPSADDDSPPWTIEVTWTSSDPDVGLGKGDKPNDVVQVDLYNFLVRAELGKDGTPRTYTFTYRITDGCGAYDETTMTVTVQPRR